MKLNDRILARLDALDMKQTELSQKTGIPPTTLNGYVRGRREPDLETIRRLAEALETTVAYLTDGSPAPYVNEYGVTVIPADPAKVAEEEAERLRMRDENRENMRQSLNSDTTKKSPQHEAEGGVDAELQEYLEELRTRPEQRMLFSLTKNATKEDVEASVRIVEAYLNKGNNNE